MSMDTIVPNPVLYILMRSDLESMNPGKAVAQGVHAGHQFVNDMTVPPFGIPHHHAKILGMYEIWKEETGIFGVTVTLDVDHFSLPSVVAFARKAGFLAGVTHDPSYPLKDGEYTHLLPLDTCGYVFGDKAELAPLLRQFGLLK